MKVKAMGQQFTKLGRKYQHDWLCRQSINSDKHLPQSPFTGQFFLDDDKVALTSTYIVI